jgi:hypothetical protein
MGTYFSRIFHANSVFLLRDEQCVCVDMMVNLVN